MSIFSVTYYKPSVLNTFARHLATVLDRKGWKPEEKDTFSEGDLQNLCKLLNTGEKQLQRNAYTISSDFNNLSSGAEVLQAARVTRIPAFVLLQQAYPIAEKLRGINLEPKVSLARVGKAEAAVLSTANQI